MKYVSLILFTIIILTSCARVYYSPDAENISKKHKIIAVAIPKVSIPPQKNMTAMELKTLSEQEAEIFQSQMVNWLLKRKGDKKLKIDILDASTTVAKLNNAKTEGRSFSPHEIAEMLNVDAVLSSSYKLTKPMSTGAAIATTLLFGFGTTNEIVVTMELHDRQTNKMIMSFNHTLSGGLFDTSDRLVDEIMRIASKKLPYTKFSK